MLGLTRLEVNNSIFNITEENNKFELYTDTFDEFSFKDLKDALEEIPNVSNISPKDLGVKSIGPRDINADKKLYIKKVSTDGYYFFKMA